MARAGSAANRPACRRPSAATDNRAERSAIMSGACRIIVGVSGSPTNLPTLRHAMHLAHGHDATLIPVLARLPPGDAIAGCGSPSGYLYLDQVCRDDAWQRLWDALDAASGGLPPDVRAEPMVLRGEPGRVLVSVASQAGDMLVVGTGRHGGLSRLRHGNVSRYCLAHARCPVLAVPPPALELEAGHGLRGWAFRHRALNLDRMHSPASGR
ncbi:MAG: universal stress protein [Streptosporangiaceae bacterium]